MEEEDSNRFQFEILNPRKIGSYPEIFGQTKRHNINRCSPTISVIMAQGSEECYKFQGTESIGMPAVSQQRDFQINPEESTSMIQIFPYPRVSRRA